MSAGPRRRIPAALFVGPSVEPADLKAIHPDIEVLPPAAQGDIYRIAQFAPDVIGLVDGTFHSAPAPWHKEILWALSQGITVLGAASMGALRAAEMASFGMIPVGSIANDYATGVLEDDDEVAIVHGPAKLGYPAASFAMADLRATMRSSGLATSVRLDITAAAKRMHFRDRTFDALFDQCGVPDVREWLQVHWVNQKRADALLLIDQMTACLGQDNNQTRSWTFTQTPAWSAVQRKHHALFDTPEVGVRELIEEIALRGLCFVRKTGVDLSRPPRIDIDTWVSSLVGTLSECGAYVSLRDRALAKRRAERDFGTMFLDVPAEDVVAQHFSRIGDPVPWFRNRARGAWRTDPDFWSAMTSYAEDLGLDDGDHLVNTILRDRLTHGAETC